MADGSMSSDPSGPTPREVATLGDELDGLLTALRRAELRIGPREQVAAHALAVELVAHGRVRVLGDLRHALKPLLARSAAEREAYDLVLDAHAPETKAGNPAPLPEPATKPPRRWWRYVAAVVLLAALGSGLVHYLRPTPTVGPYNSSFQGGYDSTFDKGVSGPKLVEPPPITQQEALDRIAKAAVRFGGAPTLEELAGSLVSARRQFNPGVWVWEHIADPILQASSRVRANDDEELSNKLMQLHRKGAFAEAIPIAQQIAVLREKSLGANHPDLASGLNNLAQLYRALGRYEEAEPLYSRALSIQEKALGPNHTDVGFTLNNLAELYLARGRYSEAEPLLKRSISIQEKALGPDHPYVAAILANLAALYRGQGRSSEAEPIFKRSLAIREKVLGPEHPDVARSLSDLADVYQILGRYADAEPLYKRSLHILEKTLGPKHLEVATCLSNLAGLYEAQGRFAEAQSLYKRSLVIREDTLGPDHPMVASSRNRLTELHRWVADINWPPESYAIKLSEWTGLPLGRPIALYGPDGRNGETWARLALALARIEQPGREPKYTDLLTAANDNLAKRTPEQIPLAYRLATVFADKLPHNDPAAATRDGLIRLAEQAAQKASLGGPPGTPLAADRFGLHRALAITPGLTLPRDFTRDASWLSARTETEAAYAPWWAPLVAFAFPVAFAVLWLANSLALRKAFLRRRPPELPPLHMDIVSQIKRRITEQKGRLRRIAQRLLVRTPETTDRIDLPGTIAATLATGGHLTPAYQRLYRTPEYLVLIERHALPDQEAERMRMLVRRLGDMVPVTIFSFDGDPALLVAERGSQRPQPIEQVVAAHADHRLIVLGSGEGFLDPVSLRARPAAQRLTHFRHRALLTPVPLAEWGREEFSLAQELGFPIGRATMEGMEHLAELLGLDGAEDGKLLDPHGDGLARALPEMLRVHPERFFYSSCPSDVELPQLLRELRNFLDPAGYEWLSALAVYPAVQWDLTLYLGVTLPEKAGGKPEAKPVYREDRIAALTQLPWLREGVMPAWLRRALIAELGHTGRADEVREALQGLIQVAKQQGEQRRDDDVVLRIAREQPIEGFDPERLYDDEVLLDFMARGRVEDFALPRRTLLEAILPRGLLDRIGVPGLVAGAVAMVYAAAAWWVTPKLDGLPWGLGEWTADPGDRHALTIGAWGPLGLLAASGLAALVLSNLELLGQHLRAALVRLSPLSLAFALVMATFCVSALLPKSMPGSEFPSSFAGAAEAASIALVLLALAVGQGMCRWLWIGETKPRGTFAAIGSFLAASLALWLIVALTKFAAEPLLPISRAWLYGWLCAAALLTFLTGWRAARWTAKPVERVHAKPSRWPALANVATVLLLIAPAIVAAHHIGGVNAPLAAMALGSGVTAGTPDGRFLAIGDADGCVHVIDMASRAEPGSLNTHLGAPISSLAVAAPEPGYPDKLLIAAGVADGRAVVRYYGLDAALQSYAWAEHDDARSHGHAPLVALSPDGHLLLAIEDREGRAVLLSGARPDQRVVLQDTGVVTALTALDRDRFAVATMDGGIRLVTAPTNAALAIASEAALRIAGSRVRRMSYDAAAHRLDVLGDDGTVLVANLDAGGLHSGDPAKRDNLAALGPAVGWKATRQVCDKGVVVLLGGSAEASCIGTGQSFRDCPTCPEMVVVPAGKFLMGSPQDEKERADNEGPQHEVTIAKPLAVGKFQMTFDDWDACVAGGGCKHKPEDQGWGRAKRPVINVSWNGITGEYLPWLNRKLGLSGAGAYRLLTEAEWEYAARAGTTTKWSFGDDEKQLGDYAWFTQNSDSRPHPVGEKKPNPFGLYDMHGNAWEWVKDCYVDNYKDAPADGAAVPDKANCDRVLRGGTWYDDPRYLRSAVRLGDRPVNRHGSHGFRVGRSFVR